MTKLTDTLSGNDLWTLERKAETVLDELLDELMLIEDLERRKLKLEMGLYARLEEARGILHLIYNALVTDATTPVVRLPGAVTVALWDARISLD
jgi:hypothetical protein